MKRKILLYHINMIDYGLAGMRMENDGISFSPWLAENVHYLVLSDIKYRQAVLKIIIKGNGSTVKSFLLNGKPQ